MPILYSAVAYHREVLFKHACCDGNFDDVLCDVMNKVSCDDHKMTYYHRRYLLHYMMDNEYLYFCVTDKLCQRSRAFLFLKEIKRRYLNNKTTFNNTLVEQMIYYNNDDSVITIDSGDIDEINSIGVDSGESLLGEKILIVRNDYNLKYTTVTYVDTKPETAVVTFRNDKRLVKIIAIILFVISLFVINPLFVIVMFAILYFIVR